MSAKEIRRRKVASLIFIGAWRLKRRSNITMSCALLVSWRMFKGSLRIRYSKVVGVTFENRQMILRKLYGMRDSQVALHVEREPSNKFDVNAIKVIAAIDTAKHHIGYIPKNVAAMLAPMIDAGYKMVLFYDGVYGGSKQNTMYGLTISYTLLEPEMVKKKAA